MFPCCFLVTPSNKDCLVTSSVTPVHYMSLTSDLYLCFDFYFQNETLLKMQLCTKAKLNPQGSSITLLYCSIYTLDILLNVVGGDATVVVGVSNKKF